MRHRMHGRKLGRTSAHRKAMFRNQLTALFTHERIVTTIEKAKELRPIAERMITIARKQDIASRRRVATWVQDKTVARRLFDEIAPRFDDRPGGYTRIMRLGRRKGDNAQMAIIEFVDYELDLRSSDESGEPQKRSLMQRMFGGGAAETAEAAEAAEAADDDSPATDEEASEAPEAEAATEEKKDD